MNDELHFDETRISENLNSRGEVSIEFGEKCKSGRKVRTFLALDVPPSVPGAFGRRPNVTMAQ